MKKNKVAKSLLEVWEWKKSAYREVEDLPTEEAIIKRITDSVKTTEIIGLSLWKKPVEKLKPQHSAV